jgi:hypothetical protein
MKDERERIINERNKFQAMKTELGMMESAFTQIGCRYRRDGTTLCEHPRWMLKKYPQHEPYPKDCNPEVCPRN